MNGQTSLVVVLLLMVLLAGGSLFLLSFAQAINQDEYINLFAHNFLLAGLRANTGFTDPACRTVTDTATCAFFNPGYACNNQVPCTEAVKTTLTGFAMEVGLARRNFRYLIVIEGEGFIARSPDGTPFRVEVGDTSLKNKSGKRYVANERLQTVLSSGIATLKATVIVAPKS